MSKLKPYSSSLLVVGGSLLVAMGIYFVFLRPHLLPEDSRYMGSNLNFIQSAIPGLSGWLQKVFWVMGGYIFTTGVLTIYLALTSFRSRAKGAFGIATISGIGSIGLMVTVNFVIDSEFKFILAAFALPWAAALVLYQLRK